MDLALLQRDGLSSPTVRWKAETQNIPEAHRPVSLVNTTANNKMHCLNQSRRQGPTPNGRLLPCLEELWDWIMDPNTYVSEGQGGPQWVLALFSCIPCLVGKKFIYPIHECSQINTEQSKVSDSRYLHPMASFARKICPVAKSVPSPNVVFTILLPALVSWGIMTEAGLWFVFCLLSPILQRRETLHGLFSTLRRKIYPTNAGEYYTIVVLKKKID